jgi:hypothetical protein
MHRELEMGSSERGTAGEPARPLAARWAKGFPCRTPSLPMSQSEQRNHQESTGENMKKTHAHSCTFIYRQIKKGQLALAREKFGAFCGFRGHVLTRTLALLQVFSAILTIQTAGTHIGARKHGIAKIGHRLRRPRSILHDLDKIEHEAFTNGRTMKECVDYEFVDRVDNTVQRTSSKVGPPQPLLSAGQRKISDRHGEHRSRKGAPCHNRSSVGCRNLNNSLLIIHGNHVARRHDVTEVRQNVGANKSDRRSRATHKFVYHFRFLHILHISGIANYHLVNLIVNIVHNEDSISINDPVDAEIICKPYIARGTHSKSRRVGDTTNDGDR